LHKKAPDYAGAFYRFGILPPFNGGFLHRLLPTGRVLMLSGRNAGIDCAFAGLSTHSGHTLLVGSERAIAKVVCYGAGAPWIIAGHGRRSGGDDKQSGKSEE
jgi:hypothetical protein